MITSTIHSIVASAQPSREDFYAADGLSKPSMQNGWAMAVAPATVPRKELRTAGPAIYQGQWLRIHEAGFWG